MDGRHFDALSRGIAASQNRRGFLRVVAGSMLGGGVAAVNLGSADAANRICRLAGQKCVRDGQCCSGNCDTARATPRARRNRCSCGTQAVCDGRCFDTQTDPDNCGACGTVCPDEWGCTEGECLCGGELSGAQGEICCDNAWIDPLSDPDHCGGCHQAVPEGGSCIQGTVVIECPMLDSLGTCWEGYTCTVALDGSVYYFNQASPWAWGCANAGAPACASGQFCSLVYRNRTMDAQEPWQSGANYGLCLSLTIPCAP